MSVIDKIRAKAAADVKHVVLAEGSEPRTVQAAEKIVKLGLAKITLVGAKAEIEAKAETLAVGKAGMAGAKCFVLAMLAAFAALALYTFGKAVYDIGRNDGSRMVTDHAGQVELSVKTDNNHNVTPYLYGTDEERNED